MRPEYVILSERLIKEVVDRKAKRGFTLTNVQARPPFTTASLDRNDGRDNYHLLAEQAEQALYDETGTPEDPGTYIGLRATFMGWIFTFDQENAKVGWLAAKSPDGLTVLCTSARNFLGYEAPEQYSGWRPSNALGLRDVVVALRASNPEKLLDYQADAEGQRAMASAAAYVTRGLEKEGPPDFRVECDVLLRQYVYVEDFSERFVTGDHLAYRRVIVGAPLWARAPSELPPPGAK